MAQKAESADLTTAPYKIGHFIVFLHTFLRDSSVKATQLKIKRPTLSWST